MNTLLNDFEKLVTNKTDVIKIYNDVSLMSGQGEEWLLDSQDQVIAVFIDGNFRCQVLRLTNDKEVTKTI